MKKTILCMLLALFGCADNEQNAISNVKKGDDFFDRKEYEVAEYYYEKIPEDSPLYNHAKRKLDEIAVIKKHWVEKEIPAAEVAKIQILNHGYAVDNVRHVPSHSLELYNNLAQNIEYVTVEFKYVDEQGTVVAAFTTEVHTSMFPNTRKLFRAVEPGYVAKKFVKAEAKIVTARYN